MSMRETVFNLRWNNRLSAALGVLALVCFVAVLIVGANTAGFIALVVIGGMT